MPGGNRDSTRRRETGQRDVDRDCSSMNCGPDRAACMCQDLRRPEGAIDAGSWLQNGVADRDSRPVVGDHAAGACNYGPYWVLSVGSLGGRSATVASRGPRRGKGNRRTRVRRFVVAWTRLVGRPTRSTSRRTRCSSRSLPSSRWRGTRRGVRSRRGCFSPTCPTRSWKAGSRRLRPRVLPPW